MKHIRFPQKPEGMSLEQMRRFVRARGDLLGSQTDVVFCAPSMRPRVCVAIPSGSSVRDGVMLKRVEVIQ